MAKSSPSRKRRPWNESFEMGSADGFRTGFDHGYWFGQCEAVRSSINPAVTVWPVHVMFVETGKGFPYSPLDQAVGSALTRLVARLTVVNGSNQPVAEIAASLRPDIVIVLDGLQFDVKHVIAMREAGIRTALWTTDDPYYTDMSVTLVPHYDVIFTLERNCVELYQRIGCKAVYYLPFCASPEQYYPLNPERSKRKEISFIGSAYMNRVRFFNAATSYLASRDTLISGIWWDRLDRFDQLKDKIMLGNWMDPNDTALAYNASKIVINMHRAHDDPDFNLNKLAVTAASPNPRTFEIAACAVLQLCDIRDDLASFYTPGLEIVTYSTAHEMIEKLDYYLHHEQERREIALRGMWRTLRDHTYTNRLQTMLSILFPQPLIPI
ncbi:glycosyltransferase [Paenibacillus sp. NEAU-GSW1]|uniref:CgeB family protein n=1 Tax=Paenibacillus sp. NEAU-GSW1 TaxID=2682486 RepID=UPI0012E11925|nr:glycosyltransferase [Paenibacillus sp. NEAU-GSW1]MUT65860.1 glycosyltransferase [Paenibacillus sp. NEAU-GSW1]